MEDTSILLLELLKDAGSSDQTTASQAPCISYARRTNIPIYEETGMWNLVRKAQSLLKLVQEVTSTTHLPITAQKWIMASDASFHDHDSPVPKSRLNYPRNLATGRLHQTDGNTTRKDLSPNEKVPEPQNAKYL